MSHLLESASTHQFGFKSKLVYKDTHAFVRIYISLQSQFLKLILNDNAWSWAHYMNIDIPLSDLNKLSDDYITMKVDELLRTLSEIMHPNIFIPSLTTTINHVYDVDFKNLIENCQHILGMKLIDYDSFLPNHAYDNFYFMCNHINAEIHKLNKFKEKNKSSWIYKSITKRLMKNLKVFLIFLSMKEIKLENFITYLHVYMIFLN